MRHPRWGAEPGCTAEGPLGPPAFQQQPLGRKSAPPLDTLGVSCPRRSKQRTGRKLENHIIQPLLGWFWLFCAMNQR